MTTGAEIHQYPDPAAVFSPDGRSILLSGETTSTILDIQTGKMLRQFAGGTGSVAFSPDGRTVATTNADAITLWDAENGQEIRQLSVSAAEIFVIVFSPDGRYVAASTDKTARLWDVQTGEQLHEFVGHSELDFAQLSSITQRLNKRDEEQT